jgi:hypothetical protein
MLIEKLVYDFQMSAAICPTDSSNPYPRSDQNTARPYSAAAELNMANSTGSHVLSLMHVDPNI